RAGHQAVNRQSPLLSATLPDGARVQMIGPPATRRHWAMAIRRHIHRAVSLEAYAPGPITARAARRPAGEQEAAARADPVAFLKQAVAARRTILISGGTSSGKTTFLNSLLAHTDPAERIVLVEDTAEIAAPHQNAVGLIAVKGNQGEAEVGVDDLLQASLRMRPDRIILGEIRGAEAITFLRAVNTGHPGSLSTIHADSPERAIDQLALLVLQAGSRLSWDDVVRYIARSIDVIVQLDRSEGVRRIAQLRITQPE
ncbi:MAG: P-type DNA transfer ATPase VirB11, partial [Novosphingobium sp.]